MEPTVIYSQHPGETLNLIAKAFGVEVGKGNCVGYFDESGGLIAYTVHAPQGYTYRIEPTPQSMRNYRRF